MSIGSKRQQHRRIVPPTGPPFDLRLVVQAREQQPLDVGRIAAAGATNAGRPISETARNTTPTTSSAMAKWTNCGW